ncbi:MAG: thiamine phosphate synthase [Gemmatimonadota bacterium]|nr:thiamine phosphate synthase [Gemmatimonadota bacterium]
MNREIPRLHAIATEDIIKMPDFLERAKAIAAAGRVAFHVRGKDAHGKWLAESAFHLQGVIDGADLYLNDRVDVALAVHADGVQLPQNGLPVGVVRSLIPETWPVGRSTHSAEEIDAAFKEGADFVLLGHIFETATHPDIPPLGPKAIEASSHEKTIAIGGINPDRVLECVKSGAYGVAAVSSLWLAEDPGSAAKKMLLSLPD